MAAARTVGGVNWTAIGLLVFTILGLAALVIVSAVQTGSAASTSSSAKDLAILLEIAVPTVIMIVIQWWFVRRRWIKRTAASGRGA